MSEALHFASHRLQEISLLFMAIVYIMRVRWIMKFGELVPRHGN